MSKKTLKICTCADVIVEMATYILQLFSSSQFKVENSIKIFIARRFNRYENFARIFTTFFSLATYFVAQFCEKQKI